MNKEAVSHYMTSVMFGSAFELACRIMLMPNFVVSITYIVL